MFPPKVEVKTFVTLSKCFIVMTWTNPGYLASRTELWVHRDRVL